MTDPQQPFQPLGLPPQPEAPPPAPARPSRREGPFWTYSDLAVFIGMAVVSLFLALLFSRLLEIVFHPKVRTIVLLPAQFLGYALMFTGLFLLFRWEYSRPFWRSLGWTSLRVPPLVVIVAGLVTAFGVALASTLIKTPNTANPMTEMLENPTSLVLVAIFGITPPSQWSTTTGLTI